MTTYYAICDANGPISVRIEADSLSDAMAIVSDADRRAWIDEPRLDAEDDLDFCADGFSRQRVIETMNDIGWQGTPLGSDPEWSIFERAKL